VAIVLADTQYGKAETRVVRIRRETDRHEVNDLDVNTALRGSFDAAHTHGDQRFVLPTDSQKNTVFAYAKEVGVEPVERYALALARHFVRDVEPVSAARVEVEQFSWRRAVVDGAEHDHTWVRRGEEVRTAAVTVESSDSGPRVHVVAGLKDLVLLKSTGSQFAGFLEDEYTTLAETYDRVMATAVVARWRYGLPDADADGADVEGVDFTGTYQRVKDVLVREFATVHSLALQQTLWHMGSAVLREHPELAEIRLSAPNRHHVAVDLTPFGLDNAGEVFHADDRPYGLIQASVRRDDDGTGSDSAWLTSAAFG
jgi:urate oxidase